MVTECQFIAWGLTKDKWPEVTPDLIQTYLDNPALLDNLEQELFLEAFYYYFDWFWANQNYSLTS